MNSSMKTTNSDSPKTPGGISKSLLTPCRRVGLSRKWKKSGVSPFISPLSSASSNKEVKLDNQIKKRKRCNAEVEETDTGDESCGEIGSDICNTPKIDIDRTPTRSSLPRKKSKTIITAQEAKKCQEEVDTVPQSISELNNINIKSHDDNLQQDSIKQISNVIHLITDDENVQQDEKQVSKVSKLSRKNSKKAKITVESGKTEQTINSNIIENFEKNENQLQNKDISKEKSPNNLTKECIVVIQKKIFKTIKDITHKNITSTENIKESVPTVQSGSQTLFDSDSDDVPLSNFNTMVGSIKTDKVIEEITIYPKETEDRSDLLKQNSHNIMDLTTKEIDDNDFIEKKKVNIKRVEKTTSTTGLKNKAREKPKTTKLQIKSKPKPLTQSSNSFDDDDDFDYGKSKTILIKRTYDKVTKPLKMKSTGSITQKDIDDLKARIESKKNLLLAKAMTNETKELRDLIKKWQLGCQTALNELLHLMKQKMPDQNMEHSELLQMLKIPPDLVGYDSDSECFNTPDDTTVILSALKLN
ncbi:jg19305 [Pararge aegeria aegeria]|uniref:Jg19305 protein n=1 Tax=Pararge aegeria aegeria TaxID=348720 RepID=A0A8S4RJD3_9NEOP|nr:jg19305 [Pararge aegeria aegeria]